VNVRNELTSFSAGYDANGNLTSDSSRSFVYDDENQLIQVTYGSGIYRINFSYDGFGRLRSQAAYSWNGSSFTLSSTTRYMLASQARHELVSQM
jgi:YD repeat-containing protein